MLMLLLILHIVVANTAYLLVGNNNTQCTGLLTVRNNLLGDELTISVEFTGSECVAKPYMSHIVVLDANVDSVLSNSTSLDTSRCDETVRLLISIEVGSSILVPASSNCTSSTLQDCKNRPILYSLNNCLVSRGVPSTTTPGNSSERHAPLCWYHQCLNGNLTSNATLCGLPVCTIMYRSNLYMHECGDGGNATHMSAWYQMAVQLITYQLNHGEEEAYRYIWWLVGNELLERHCYATNHPLSVEEMREPNSFFRMFIARFEKENAVANTHVMPCIEIKQHFDSLYNETMSAMLYNKWSYATFKFILMPNRDMETHAIMLVLFICTLPFFLFAFLVYCIYRIRRRS